jgi:DNA-binding CsgD family transcriptional regulator
MLRVPTMTIPDDELCGQQTLDFLEQVNKLETTASIQVATFTAIGQYGLTYATCAVVPTPGMPASGGVLLNNRPQEYTDRYIAQNYATKDPVIVELAHTLRPFSWQDVRARRALTKQQLAIMDEGREFGANDGLVIPILTQNGTMSIFAPCGLTPNLSPRARSAIEIICVTAHQALRRAEFDQLADHRPLLSVREREVLLWVACGKTDHEIGMILSMQTMTATQHVANAMKKLNVHKRLHAVVEAIRRKEISP